MPSRTRLLLYPRTHTIRRITTELQTKQEALTALQSQGFGQLQGQQQHILLQSPLGAGGLSGSSGKPSPAAMEAHAKQASKNSY
eukprot:7017-Heterococcus_DN1.PRE.4